MTLPGAAVSVEEMVRRVVEEGLLQPGHPVVVLLSGGRDSTCLLDIAARVCLPQAVVALHVNYGLREEAAEDERHCAELCLQEGVRLVVVHPQPSEGGNLQAWARDERFRVAKEIATARDADVAAGHTATDQVETILYRLASSPSRRALLGMRPRDGGVVRPLLAFRREDTAAYCEERGLRWREDVSNLSDAYARNRIRSQLLPALRAVHPAAEENVLSVAAILREEAKVLDALVERELDGASQIVIARLGELAPALRRLIVQRLADEAVGRPAPGAARRADEICALHHGSLDLPHGVRAIVERGVLRFAPTPPKPNR